MITPNSFENLSDFTKQVVVPSGIVKSIKQSLLVFGFDRRQPAHSRPVVILAKARNPIKVIVLPCTSQKKTGSSNFFKLDSDNAMWQKNKEALPYSETFVYWRHELIDQAHITKNYSLGVLYHPTRLSLLEWWKSCLERNLRD